MPRFTSVLFLSLLWLCWPATGVMTPAKHKELSLFSASEAYAAGVEGRGGREETIHGGPEFGEDRAPLRASIDGREVDIHIDWIAHALAPLSSRELAFVLTSTHEDATAFAFCRAIELKLIPLDVMLWRSKPIRLALGEATIKMATIERGREPPEDSELTALSVNQEKTLREAAHRGIQALSREELLPLQSGMNRTSTVSDWRVVLAILLMKAGRPDLIHLASTASQQDVVWIVGRVDGFSLRSALRVRTHEKTLIGSPSEAVVNSEHASAESQNATSEQLDDENGIAYYLHQRTEDVEQEARELELSKPVTPDVTLLPRPRTYLPHESDAEILLVEGCLAATGCVQPRSSQSPLTILQVEFFTDTAIFVRSESSPHVLTLLRERHKPIVFRELNASMPSAPSGASSFSAEVSSANQTGRCDDKQLPRQGLRPSHLKTLCVRTGKNQWEAFDLRRTRENH